MSGEAAIGSGEFLQGGGEMGALMRAHDWSATSLGPPETWPQSLRSPVSILLPSKAQICLFWGPDLVALYNDAYRPVLGIKHPWALGRPVSEVWKEIWDDVLRPLLEKVQQTGEAFRGNDYPFFLERYGYPEETYFDVSYDPVRDESGRVGGVFCIVSETTGRVVGERRLRTLRNVSNVAGEAQNSEDAFRRVASVLAANPQDLPFALLYDGRSESGDPHCVAATGIEKVAGDPWPFAEAAAHRTEIILEGEALAHCGPLPRGPWPEPITSVATLPILGMGQGSPGFLVAGLSPRRALDESYRDFLRLVASNTAAAVGTARALAEERSRAEALVELDRAKTLFFSNISHEFRTPLTLMLGPVEDILNDRADALSDSHRQKLDLAHRNSLRLLKLVNSLLDFSRIEAGRIEVAYAPVDLGALTTELASVFRSAVETAGMRLLVDCPPLAEPVYVDREMWEKIVLNLLSNAFKFTFAGEIEVNLRRQGDGVELQVRDTGIGISADQLPHVFERFHRVPDARSRSHEGSGIGLALVHELVKLHGGRISVESAPDRGTCFTVRLRTGTSHLPPDRIRQPKAPPATSVRASAFVDEALRWLPDDAIAAEAERQPRSPGGVEPGVRILWADDNADMRDYVSRILSPHWTVTAVADGLAALESARRDPPSLVLADVMMPRLDGFGLLRALRADERTRATPVILLSARAGEEAKVEGLDAGADDYLIKPFSPRELVARIRTHLQMVRLRRDFTVKTFESEAWFNVAVKAAGLGVWHADAVTWDVGGDENLMRVLGLPPNRRHIPADEWRALVHPEDRVEVLDSFAACVAGTRLFDAEFRIVRPNGETCWVAGHGDIVSAPGEGPRRIVGVVQDITARKKLIDNQQLLLNELNHRVRNTLATVLSLARQTAAGALTIPEFVAAFQARIVALSAAHTLLTRNHWDSVSLRDLVTETLAPLRAAGSFLIEGPDCDLLPRQALALSLGLHELAANACRYGALTVPSGRVGIAWDTTTRDRGRGVHLRWSEEGGPAVDPPQHRGFGSRLIEHALPSDLDGDVQLEFDPAGVRCTIEFVIENERRTQLRTY